jgi:MoxR-like ATPase
LDHINKLPRPVVIQKEGFADIEVTSQHYRFEDLCKLVSAGLVPYMVGPAGGGKTEAANVLAKGLELAFVPLSLGPQTTQAQIFGYYDATGNYVGTPFRKAYENGGLILLDELDRCNERVSVTLNSAIANGRCSFPDGTVDRHENCYLLAAANTRGHGADRQYVSARQQDASLLDRFAVLDWGYDESFETQLASSIWADVDGWLTLVRRVRKAVVKHDMRYIVSPRASIHGAQGLRAGLSERLLRETVLFRGWTEEDRVKIEEELGVE